MAPVRSRRLRLLEGLRRTLGEMLHDRVWSASTNKGRKTPYDTSTIYTVASDEAPDLLDQVLLVHHRVRQERGEVDVTDQPRPEDDERKRMLSAVRATLRQSEVRFHT